VPVPGTDANGKPFKNTSVITIDSREFTGDKKALLDALEAKLYGTDGTDTYTAVADPGVSDNPSTKGWYERSGAGTSESPYVYTLSQDTVVDNEKTYYAKSVVGDADPYLPLPAEVISTLSTTVGG